MSLNPFDSSLLPEGSDLRDYTSQKVFAGIDLWCKDHPIQCSLIAGPKGIGKTTLIERYFTKERCRALAKDSKNLVQLCYFTSSQLRSDADVFLTLIEAVNKSLNNLDKDSEDYWYLKEAFRELSQKPEYAEVRTDDRQGRGLLEALTSELRENDYCVTLVIDDFQQLTCSGNCAVDTFSTMANLVQNHLISYIVVTDYHVKVGSQNYAISSFERIFHSDPLIPSGVTKKKAVSALQNAIRERLTDWEEDEDDPITFTDDELAGLWTLTAGIPALLQCGLKTLYRYREGSREPLTWEGMQTLALSSGRELMNQWTKHLDPAYWDTLCAVLDYGADKMITENLPTANDRRSELRDSGLIVKNEARQTWSMICPLFETYVRQELARPQKQEDDLAKYLKLIKQYGGGEIPFKVEINHINTDGGDVVQSGASVTKQTLKAENVQIVQGTTASDLLRILSGTATEGLPGTDSRGLFAQALSQQLQKALPADGIQLPERAVGISDEEYARQCDEQFERVGQQIIQDVKVDEDQELVDVSEAELMTLDRRFAEARSRCGRALTDEILATQSERCQFYLKLSVVVEDALDFPVLGVNDYSPQLVLYGKALEQSLRDNLFDLFHRDGTLSVYDTYQHRNDPNSKDVFKNKTVDKTLIGNYPTLINEKKRYLGSLSSQYCGGHQTEREWSRWWDQLQHDLHAARNIRNSADHPEKNSPGKDSLNDMCDYLIGKDGTEGILSRLTTGLQLFHAKFPGKISQQCISDMVDKICTAEVTERKSNGGFNAKTLPDGYLVKIPRSSVLTYKAANPDAAISVGMNLSVKITKFMKQDEEFFSAEIVSTVTA